MDPVTLLTGCRDHIAECRPQSKRAIPDRHHRRSHATAPQIAPQLGPAVGRFALAITDGDQLLGVGGHAHDHQTAPPGLLQAHLEVDAVGPGVHLVPVGQVPTTERLVVRLPGAKQPAYGRC